MCSKARRRHKSAATAPALHMNCIQEYKYRGVAHGASLVAYCILYVHMKHACMHGVPW
jgi:hypothetical protein